MNEKKAVKIMEITKKTYELIGSEFSATRDRIWPEMEELAKKYVKQGDKVLDVGCGNGRLIEVLPKVDYLGVDSSEVLLKKIKDARVRKLDILELDKLDENNFDAVFCFASFNHVAGKELRLKVLADIKKLLKPAGWLIMTNWNIWRLGVKKSIWHSKKIGFKDVMTVWTSGDGKKRGEIYYRAFTRAELKRLFRKSGFKILENYYSQDGRQAHWWSGRNIVTVGQH